jgi:rRNA biogenesis protein RRP5
MKLLGQIVSVEPLALIVSLPNQLFAHIPITHISSQLTKLLETMDGEEGEESGSDEELDDAQISTQKSKVPNLFEIFSPGQYVRSVVTAVHAPGSTDILGMGRQRDEVQKTSRRVELSLEPGKVNASVVKADLSSGFVSGFLLVQQFLTISKVLSAAVASVEDHGYILDLGVSDVSGFLSFKNVTKSLGKDGPKLRIGQLVDVTVSKISGNGRTCELSVEKKSLLTASVRFSLQSHF